MTTPIMEIGHTPDGNVTAAKNEQRLLYALHRYGWLTARQAGRLIWPDGRQGQRMAQRTLHRLSERSVVDTHPLPRGGTAYLLTPQGAAELRAVGVMGVRSKGGKDLPLAPSAVYHRAISNAFLIDRTVAILDKNAVDAGDVGVWTEHEIQRRRAPRPAIFPDGQSFVPDGMWHQDARHIWVEVENSAKSPARLDALVRYADRVLRSEEEPPRYDELISPDSNALVGWTHGFLLLCPNDNALRAVIRALSRYGADPFCAASGTSLSVARVQMSPALVWGGVTGEWSVDQLIAAGLVA